MILYHGSTDLVSIPEIRKGISFLDFGAGFYTTSSYTQAERWSKIKMRRNNVRRGYVSVYHFDEETARQVLVIRRFLYADREWLMFVCRNRRGEILDAEVDLHIGPVADDNVYRCIRLFEAGVYDTEETIKRLKSEVLHDQWTFHTEKALTLCRFVDAREIVSGG